MKSLQVLRESGAYDRSGSELGGVRARNEKAKESAESGSSARSASCSSLEMGAGARGCAEETSARQITRARCDGRNSLNFSDLGVELKRLRGPARAQKELAYGSSYDVSLNETLLDDEDDPATAEPATEVLLLSLQQRLSPSQQTRVRFRLVLDVIPEDSALAG
mmetsp:Transcript_9771/g.26045  ORF Transcript_9771/g.26045 Transcript_9771/m.26045 type:complete len:164 (-) Transcript_9771:133-624(-)